jgi:hypothetical protein
MDINKLPSVPYNDTTACGTVLSTWHFVAMMMTKCRIRRRVSWVQTVKVVTCFGMCALRAPECLVAFKETVNQGCRTFPQALIVHKERLKNVAQPHLTQNLTNARFQCQRTLAWCAVCCLIPLRQIYVLTTVYLPLPNSSPTSVSYSLILGFTFQGTGPRRAVETYFCLMLFPMSADENCFDR